MKRLEKKSYKNVSIGSWITMPDLCAAEIMTMSGFDWLAVDMEHSAITIEKAQEIIRIINLAGCVPFVRVGENDPVLIKRVMDAGAHGVIIPMVNSKDDAIRAVSAVKYPPMGSRGVGLARAQGYGLDFEGYKKWVNKNTSVIVQIEHIDAMADLEGIICTDGVDASIIGPYDLSASLGCPGDFSKKEVKAVLKKYITVCKKLKKPAGFHVIQPDADALKAKIKEGFSFLALSLDSLFLGTKIAEELRGIGR